MKYIKWILLGIVVVIIIAVVGVFLGIDSIVRRTIETQASNSLDVKTTLGSADVSIFGGNLALRNLQVASPQGFEAPDMFSLNGAKLDVSYGQLKTDPIGIEQVTIDQPRLVIEQSNGKFNFQALMDQQSKQPPDSGNPGDGKREPGEPIRMIIHSLAINNARVVLRPGIPGLQKEIDVTVPSFELKDVGSGEGNKNGAAIKQVVLLVVTNLAQRASQSDALPAEVRQLLNLNVDQVKQQLTTELNKQLGNITKELGKNLPPDANQAIEKGIGNLLNNKNEKKPQEQKK